MGKVSKSGEYASAFIKKEKRKRKKPLTPEEKEYIIDRFKRIGIIKHPNLPLGEEIEWTEEELKQQERELCSDNKAIKQKIHKKKLKFFCNHKDIIIKNGYVVCRKCKGFLVGKKILELQNKLNINVNKYDRKK